MKTKILAFLTAMLLVLSSLLMTACDKSDSNSKTDDNDAASSAVSDESNSTGESGNVSEESSTNVDELSPKELFSHSIKTALSNDEIFDNIDFNEIVDNVKSNDTIKYDIDVVINKLASEGVTIFDETVKFNMGIGADLTNGVAKADIGFEMFGEKPEISAILAENGIYFSEFLGISDKPILATFEEMGVSVDEFQAITPSSFAAILEEMGINEDDFDKIADLCNFFVETIEKAVSNNITDEAYTTETKDVSINGVEIKNAKIITLTITAENAEGIIKDIVTDTLANETIKELLESNEAADVTVDEIMEPLGDAIESVFKSVKIINIVDNDTTVALNIELNGVETNIEFVTDEDGNFIEETTDTEEFCFGVYCAFAGNTTKIQAGLIENGSFDTTQGILTYEYTLDGNNEKLTFSLEEDGETNTYVNYEGTKNGNKHEGVLTLTDGEDKVILTGYIEDNETSGTLAITEITADMGGVKTTVPLELIVSATATDTKISIEYSIKVDIKDIITMDMTAKYSIEYTEVAIEIPSDTIGVDDLTEDDLLAWEEEFMENYPKIIEYFEELVMAMQTPSYENVASNEF